MLSHTPTLTEIDEQVQLEREACLAGLQKLRENTYRMEARTYASASVYGVTSVDTLMPHVIKRIEDQFNRRIKMGQAGVHFKQVHQYLEPVEPAVLAGIALKILLDNVFSHKEKDSLVVNVCVSVGKAVEQECQIRYYEANDPKLLSHIKNAYWHKACGTANKAKLTAILFHRKTEFRWKGWGQKLNMILGAFLVDCILECSGWFVKDQRGVGKNTRVYVVPSEEFIKVKGSIIESAELFSAQTWPMIIPPKPWSNTEVGGYLLEDVMRGHGLIRRSCANSPLWLGDVPLDFLNKLQLTAYRLNTFVFKVAEQLRDQKITVGKFFPIIEIPLPPKPFDIAENKDARQAYRRETAEALNKQHQVFRRSCRTRAQMEVAEKFTEREQFYIPWSFDYRGRAYPIPAFLSLQDTDFGKSLVRFAEESPVTGEDCEHWLAFQVATTYGLDKATITERIEWVKANQALITSVAMDPIGNLATWEAAEEPWQFMAACEEYHACIISCTRTTTGLPVAIDATCSGLQILAGLAKDASTARLVNVLPSEAPQDAYLAVANVAKTKLPENLAQLLDRKVTKRTVMTIPYNAKEYSNRAYIKEALKDKDAEFTYEELQQITKAVGAAMREIVPGPMAVMSWINDSIRDIIRDGAGHVTWTTPSGFQVHQKLQKPNIERVHLQLLGQCKVQCLNGYTDEIDKNRHKAATAPNLIHSLDASLLHLSFREFDAPFSCIHDSVLCRATDMNELNRQVRQNYIKLFAEQDYLSSFGNQIGASTPPPIIGDLDPSVVMNSTYFFS